MRRMNWVSPVREMALKVVPIALSLVSRAAVKASSRVLTILTFEAYIGPYGAPSATARLRACEAPH